jgi:hypothetical protein
VEVLTRPATEPEVKRSPMAARDPKVPPAAVDAGPVTRREWSGYVVWGALGVVVALFEFVAFVDGDATPWPTLSKTAGTLQAHHNWTAIPILAGLVVLAARIVFYPWPFRTPES